MSKTSPKAYVEKKMQPVTFEIDGKQFRSLDLESEFTMRQNKIARSILINLTEAVNNGTNLLEVTDEAKLLSLCVVEVGKKWNMEDAEANEELFNDNPAPKEIGAVLQNFINSAVILTQTATQIYTMGQAQA